MQKIFHNDEKSEASKNATDWLKTASKTAIQKTVEATGELTANIIPINITRTASRNASKESIRSAPTEYKTRKETYTPLEKRQQIIEELRLK